MKKTKVSVFNNWFEISKEEFKEDKSFYYDQFAPKDKKNGIKLTTPTKLVIMSIPLEKEEKPEEYIEDIIELEEQDEVFVFNANALTNKKDTFTNSSLVLLTINGEHYCIGNEPMEFNLDEINPEDDFLYAIDKDLLINFLKENEVDINKDHLIMHM